MGIYSSVDKGENVLETVKEEVQNLIKKLKLNYSIEEFKDNADWEYISYCQKLSEDFIKEFKDKVNWECISIYQKLSEDFIKKFKNKVDWDYISKYQKLSEDFIRKFKDKVNWKYISEHQKLSEEFIREFKCFIYWNYISWNQILSEDFIREFKDEVNWKSISIHQTLSKKFINEFKDRIDVDLYNEVHQKKSREVKIKEMKKYAKKHNLKFDGRYLYAFRDHDEFGRGLFNKTIFYEKGKYYRDWKCDKRENIQNSFGFGIWPAGNTPVKVSVKDWGVEVNYDSDGKARVWGFTVL